jgi:hypothetical protein
VAKAADSMPCHVSDCDHSTLVEESRTLAKCMRAPLVLTECALPTAWPPIPMILSNHDVEIAACAKQNACATAYHKQHLHNSGDHHQTSENNMLSH